MTAIANKNRAGLMGPEHAKTVDKAVTTDGAQTITGLKITSIGTATFETDYAAWRPTNYGVGNYQMAIHKMPTAAAWQIGFYDGVDTNASLNFQVGTLSHNGFTVARHWFGGISSDADVTLPATDRVVQHFGVLTANRLITLPSGVGTGVVIRVFRTGAGAFNLSIGGLKNLITNTWCDVSWSGSAWVLTAYGAL